MNKIIAIVGPTASGKTALSIEIAKHFNSEIISCDSMQIYKKMNIGTAKPTLEEMQGIPHHMIDICEPYDNFSCADYVHMAKQHITQIHSDNKIPIFCGGTGLYLDNVLSDTRFASYADSIDLNIRNELTAFPPDVLYERLQSIDLPSGETIHPNNTKRIIRALEIYYMTGKTKTQWDMESKTNADIYDTTIIGLDYRNRESLYDQINRRVDIMISSGLVDEVKALDINRLINTTAGQAIGYKEVISYIKNECTFDDMVEQIKLNTRRYAKRQLTWFRRNEKIVWYYAEDFNNNITKYKEVVNNLDRVLT